MMHLTAVSLDSDVDTNKELIAHGYSNFLAGIVGTVPNYLVYVNTLLYVGFVTQRYALGSVSEQLEGMGGTDNA